MAKQGIIENKGQLHATDTKPKQFLHTLQEESHTKSTAKSDENELKGATRKRQKEHQ